MKAERYRLWELDVVVKKTVVFGVVATCLTLVAAIVLLALPVGVLGTGLTGWERGLFLVGVAIGTLLRRMGYAISPIIVQQILGGHRKRTRGFVYRAMLRQIPGSRDHVPEEHIVSSNDRDRPLARLAPEVVHREEEAGRASQVLPVV